MKTLFKIIFILALIGVFSTLFFLPISSQQAEVEKTKIVTTIFPAYDFSRTLSNNTEVDIKMLIKPGTDIHSYEPTPQDIISIKEADVFVYNGGESEAWVNKILDGINKDETVVVRMMDAVDLLEENTANIVENKTDNEEKSYDEHIWTSPKNASKIADRIAQAIINRNPDDMSVIQHNLSKFKKALDELDQKFRKLSEEKTGTLIVTDRFPFRYFVDEYGFDYLAAFPGCSEQTEASPKTIAELSKIVEQNSPKIVFHLELSNTKITQTIVDSTHAKALTWHSIHNVTQEDFDAKKSYLEYMEENLTNLSEALHDRPAGKTS